MAPLRQTVYLVDDDPAIRGSLAMSLTAAGLSVEAFESAQAFLDHYDPSRPGCLILDVRMPGLGGLELQERLVERGVHIPIVFMSAHGDIPMSVKAIKAGAVDFLEKPFRRGVLLERVREALTQDATAREADANRSVVAARASRLTPREQEVLCLVVAGHSSKEVARQLNVSHRTVETYRSRIMEKLDAGSLSDLVAKAVAYGLCQPSV
jgi:two-component system, LuxR family, response regulator FixJ